MALPEFPPAGVPECGPATVIPTSGRVLEKGATPAVVGTVSDSYLRSVFRTELHGLAGDAKDIYVGDDHDITRVAP